MLEFRVDGKPLPMPRPRVYRDKFGKSRAVNSSKSTDYKRMVKIIARNAMLKQGVTITDKPVALDIRFVFKAPKSYTKKKLQAIESGELRYTKKADIDNLIKTVLDSMNATVFKDDSQVITLSANKEYGSADHTTVRVIEL